MFLRISLLGNLIFYVVKVMYNCSTLLLINELQKLNEEGLEKTFGDNTHRHSHSAHRGMGIASFTLFQTAILYIILFPFQVLCLQVHWVL